MIAFALCSLTAGMALIVYASRLAASFSVGYDGVSRSSTQSPPP